MTVPFALSIHNFVNSVGSYVGFASIVAVAILIILYFAHSRESATLRDRLDEAQQRISGLEARIGQLLQTQQRGARPAGPVAPAPVAPPVVARPPGVPQGSVRRIPNPVTAVAAASLAQAAVAPATAAMAPAAPAGVAGPALASATRAFPDAAAEDPDNTMLVPAAAAAAAAANGKSGDDHTAVLATPAIAAATPAIAAATPAAAASARAASAVPRSSVAPPPRVQIGAEDAVPPAPATGGGAKIRRIGGHPEGPAVTLPVFDDDSVGGGRFSGAMLPLVIAGIAIAVIVAGLIVITNSGGSTAGNVNNNNTNAGTTGQSLHNKPKTTAPFNAAKVTVAVLNGTAQQGLAGDVGKKLAGDGYKQGNVTNAASQTQGLTFVYWLGGSAAKANRVAAQHVARALSLPASRVHHAGAVVIGSCKISATGASLRSCGANVIVSVGQDRTGLATG